MYIDAILLIIVVLSLFFGIKKGLIFEFFSLFGLFITAMLTKQLVGKVYEYINTTGTDQYNIKFILAYVLTFLGIYIVLYLILLIAKKFFETILLGWLDKLGGAIVGFLKGVIISLFIAVILIGISNFNDTVKKYYTESYTSKLMDEVYPAFLKFLPEDFSDKVNSFQQKKQFDNIIDRVINDNNDKIQKVIKEKVENLDTEKLDEILNDDSKDMDKINEIINKETNNIDELLEFK